MHRTLGILLLILILTVAIRIRLLEAPLERDEGAYAYAGQLILQGLPQSSAFYLERFPIIYYIYALIMLIFGQTHVGIHLGLLVVNILTIVLIFLLGRRLFDSTVALVASASFAVLSFSQPTQGIFANCEHFVILPALGGILLMLKALAPARPRRGYLNPPSVVFCSGILLGLAFTIKHQAVFFPAFGILYILFKSSRDNCTARCGVFLLGVFTMTGIAWLIHASSGIFGDFWFWNFTYPTSVMEHMPLSAGLGIFLKRFGQILRPTVLLWALAGIGISALLWDKRLRPKIPFVSGLFMFSFFSICPGLYFRPHYFILLLPAVALLAGIGVSSTFRLFTKKRVLVLITVIALCSPIFAQREFLFQLTPKMLNRVSFGPNPFPESLEVAKYIKKHSSENDTIAVLGSEPQIYFYAQRFSATGYIFTSHLMERTEYALKFQEEMISDIERSQPKFLIFVNVPFSWIKMPGTKESISTWFNQYCRKNYERVGLVDMISPRVTNYHWDEESIGRSPEGSMHLSIFKRKFD